MLALQHRLTNGAPPSAHEMMEVFPCSQAQQRFWFEEQLHPGNPALNVAVRWQLEGDLADPILAETWQRLIARHSALRTCFTTVDGEPVQLVVRRAACAVRTFDLRLLTAADAQAEAERLAMTEAQTPFDLAVAPLIRVSRLVLSDTNSILLVTAHHTVCDGRSVGILAGEMGRIAAALATGNEPALEPLPTSYGRFAQAEREWLQSGSFEAEIAALRDRLRGYKQFELRTDRPRLPVQSSSGGITSRLLPRSLTAALSRLARERAATLFMTSLSALLTVLHRYTGETDIALGTQVVGRDDIELEDVVGCFINTVALRSDLRDDPTFAELLERNRDMVCDTFELRHFPLERLIEVVNPKRDLSRNALFSVNFIFQRSFIADTVYETFRLTDLPSRSAGALYDLNFFMVERPDGWRLSCEYNSDLFDEATAGALIGQVERVMASIVADPLQRLAAIPLLDAAERQTLVASVNATAAPYPPGTVHDLISAQALRTPAAPAVIAADQTLTYAELEAAANRLAREIVARIPGSGHRIGILLDRSSQLIIALLAVLKTGNAYVPLDPGYPVDRITSICEQSNLAAVISRSKLAVKIEIGDAALIDVDRDAHAVAAHCAQALTVGRAASDLAYVIYTSGSTGRPKGVEIEHGSLVNLLWAMAGRPGLSAADVLLAVTTISFDIAALEMFLPLVTGARLVIADEAQVVDGRQLLAALESSGATVMQATPITWQLLIEAGWTGHPRLRMWCGGEALSRVLADQLLDRGPDLWNMYGPTETTIWSAVNRVERGPGPVTIGPPIANTQFYVLDERGGLVPPGVPGELFIGGAGVARGYFERPGLTAERFVADGFTAVRDARLYRTGDFVRRRGLHAFEFLGRTDHQVKLRGFRIELGEIEAALLGQPEIAQAVALVRDDERGNRALWAFVSLHCAPADTDEWTFDVRRRLSRSLPHYMVPAPIVVLDALPRTPNGKIDRQALGHAVHALPSVAHEPPATPVEAGVAGLIAEMLDVPAVSRNVDIFALGFHSLLAVRLINRIADTFDVRLPLRTLFDAPTVAQLAACIRPPTDRIDAPTVRGPVTTLNPTGGRAALMYLHSDVLADGMYCRRLSAVVGSAIPIHAIAPHGTAGLALVPTVEGMALDYLPRIRAVQPHGPYQLGGFCAGGLVAYEVARLLQAQGETVDRLILINACAPAAGSLAIGDPLIRAVGTNALLEPRVRESLCYNIARFCEALGAGPRSVGRFFRARLQALLSPAQRDARMEMVDFEPFVKRRGAHATETYFAQLVAALTFHPKPYDGELTLIWGSDQCAAPLDPSAGWRPFTRSVSIVPMQGGHTSPLHDRIDELGQLLERLLR